MITPTHPPRIELPAGAMQTHLIPLTAGLAIARRGLADRRSAARATQTAQLLPPDEFTIAISPSPTPSDAILFADPQNPQQQYYLPRYRIDTEEVSGREQFRIQLSQEEQGGRLTIWLAKYPAPELAVKFRHAKELPHDLTVLLSYEVPISLENVGTGSGRKEVEFDEFDEGEIKATLLVASLPELTQLYHAMTQVEYRTTLHLVRTIAVALPESQRVPVATPVATEVASGWHDNKPAALPKPRPRLIGAGEYETRGVWYKRFQLSLENWADYADDLFTPAPDLPPCGPIRTATRTWLEILGPDNRQLANFCMLTAKQELQTLWFAIPREQVPPASVTLVLRDRRLNLTSRSSSLPLGSLLTDSAHALRVSAPNWGKAAQDSVTITSSPIVGVNPAHKLALIIDFPDKPVVPALGAESNASPLRITLASQAGMMPGEWIEPVGGSVSSESGLIINVEAVFLYANSAGTIVGWTASLRVLPVAQATTLRSLTLTFQLPAEVSGIPLVNNQVIHLGSVGWSGLQPRRGPRFWVGPHYPLAVTEPFTFAKELHDYIYRGIQPTGEGKSGFVERQVVWQDRHHTYLQDEANRSLFYYLPDCFKLSRKRTAPFYPDLQVRFAKIETIEQATCDFRAAPFVDQARLEAAAAALQQFAPAITLRPLVDAGQIKLILALPGVPGLFQARPQAKIDLRLGLEDRLVLRADRFRTLFNALFEPGASLFQGRLEIELNQRTLPPIPFVARIADLAGEIFVYSQQNSATGLAITLRNAIESPVQINDVRLWFEPPPDIEPAHPRRQAQLADPFQPVRLEVDESITVRISNAPPSDSQPWQLSLDLSHVEIEADREAVWNVIGQG